MSTQTIVLVDLDTIRAAAKRKAVDSIRSYVPEEMPLPATKRLQ